MTHEIRIRRLSGETTSLTFESNLIDVRAIKDELCLLLDSEHSAQISLFREGGEVEGGESEDDEVSDETALEIPPVKWI